MVLLLMKNYLNIVRDATDQLLFGDMSPDQWEREVGDTVVIYIGTAFLIGAGVNFPKSLTDAGQMAFHDLFHRYLGVIDDLSSEARRGIESPVGFKSRVLFTTLGIKSAYLIGREINYECRVYNTEDAVQHR